MSELDSWARRGFTADDVTHDVYRKGSGPGVIVIHEIPTMSPECVAFGQEIVDAGFTVVMPHLFGEPGAPATVAATVTVLPRLCVSKEFTTFALGRTGPIATWLRALARDLHAELGGPGVGAVGMCFTGGFALAMMVDDAIAAPVLAQPSLPFAVSRKRGADVNLSPADLAVVKRRAAAGCAVLGLRYEKDKATGTRFTTLRRELGDAFRVVEFPGSKHSTLTAHRQQGAVDAVLAFLSERLSPATGSPPPVPA